MAQSPFAIQQLVYHPNSILNEDQSQKPIETLYHALIGKSFKIKSEHEYHLKLKIEELQKKGDLYLQCLFEMTQQIINNPHPQDRTRNSLFWQERYEELEDYPEIVTDTFKDKIKDIVELMTDFIILSPPIMKNFALTQKKIISHELNFELFNNNMIQRIFRSIEINTHLKKIAVSFDFLLNQENLSCFIQTLVNSKSIQEICLTEITKSIQIESAIASMKLLFDALKLCKNITHLSFYDSFITEEFSKTIAKLIAENNSLSALTIGENCLCPASVFRIITEALIDHPTICEFYSVFTYSYQLRPNFSATSKTDLDETDPDLENDVFQYTVSYCLDLAKLIRGKTLKKLYLSTFLSHKINPKSTKAFIDILCTALSNNSSLNDLILFESHFFCRPGCIKFFKLLSKKDIGITSLKLVDTSGNINDLPFRKSEIKLIEKALLITRISNLCLKWTNRMSTGFFLTLFSGLTNPNNHLRSLYLNFNIFLSNMPGLTVSLDQHKTLKILDIRTIGDDFNCTPFIQSLAHNMALAKLFVTDNFYAGNNQDDISWFKVKEINFDKVFQNNVSLLQIKPTLKIFEPLLIRNKANYNKVITEITGSVIKIV